MIKPLRIIFLFMGFRQSTMFLVILNVPYTVWYIPSFFVMSEASHKKANSIGLVHFIIHYRDMLLEFSTCWETSGSWLVCKLGSLGLNNACEQLSSFILNLKQWGWRHWRYDMIQKRTVDDKSKHYGNSGNQDYKYWATVGVRSKSPLINKVSGK